MLKTISKSALPILVLPRAAKRVIALAVDASLCILTVWFAFYLRLGEFVTLADQSSAVIVSLCVALPIFIVSGLYRAIFRYAGWPALVAVARAIVVYGLIFRGHFHGGGRAGSTPHDRADPAHAAAVRDRRFTRLCPVLAGRHVSRA
ncbi:hypothetical protein DAI43_37605, partial [Achromobacter xylosoxidans]